MASRTIYLVSFRPNSRVRAHFAIFVPSAANPELGTIIHVVGAPMAGFMLEFKRNYCPQNTRQLYTIHPLGQVWADNIADSMTTVESKDDIPRGNLERIASRIPPPRISENFRAPVNDTTNRRCQEWTTDYVRVLVEQGIISQEALDIVQSLRDPPGHGIF